MDIQLDEDQARELRTVLEEVLRDLSSEIADTDNASFRAGLEHRRRILRQVRARVEPH